MMKNILGHAVYQLTVIFFLVFAGEPRLGLGLETGVAVLSGDGGQRMARKRRGKRHKRKMERRRKEDSTGGR